jgi:hypothetical protein
MPTDRSFKVKIVLDGCIAENRPHISVVLIKMASIGCGRISIAMMDMDIIGDGSKEPYSQDQ